MITEKGTVKTSVTIDGKVQGELNKTSRILGIIYIVLGAVLTADGLALCFWEAFNNSDDIFGTALLVVGLILLFGGIFVIIVCEKAKKTTCKFVRVEEVEFFSDYFIEREYTDGEHTSTNKVYYKWLVKIKETQNYLFLYNTRVTAVAVDKNVPPDELNTIRGLLGRASQAPPAQNTDEQL